MASLKISGKPPDEVGGGFIPSGLIDARAHPHYNRYGIVCQKFSGDETIYLQI